MVFLPTHTGKVDYQDQLQHELLPLVEHEIVVVDVGVPVDCYGHWDRPVHHHQQPVQAKLRQAK